MKNFSKELLKGKEVKIEFRLTKDGELTVGFEGTEGLIKAGMMTLIEQLAKQTKTDTIALLEEFQEVAQINKMAKHQMPNMMADIVKDIINSESIGENLDCDGDCENCDAESKHILDKIFKDAFGGNK